LFGVSNETFGFNEAHVSASHPSEGEKTGWRRDMPLKDSPILNQHTGERTVTVG